MNDILEMILEILDEDNICDNFLETTALDYGFDSRDKIALLVEIEKKYNIYIDEEKISKIDFEHTFKDLIYSIEKLI